MMSLKLTISEKGVDARKHRPRNGCPTPVEIYEHLMVLEGQECIAEKKALTQEQNKALKKLEFQVRAAISAHVDECNICESVEAVEEGRVGADHLVELQALEMAVRSRISDHLEDCTDCAEEFEGMQESI